MNHKHFDKCVCLKKGSNHTVVDGVKSKMAEKSEHGCLVDMLNTAVLLGLIDINEICYNFQLFVY